MNDSFLVAGWKRFIKAQEYRAYCMAIQQLRTLGHYTAAKEIADHKHSMYNSQCGPMKNMSLNNVDIFNDTQTSRYCGRHILCTLSYEGDVNE